MFVRLEIKQTLGIKNIWYKYNCKQFFYKMWVAKALICVICSLLAVNKLKQYNKIY